MKLCLCVVEKWYYLIMISNSAWRHDTCTWGFDERVALSTTLLPTCRATK